MGEPVDAYVAGVDAGATTTRCVVAALDGTIVARGRAGGANRNSSGNDLAAVLAEALGSARDRAIRCAVVGAAGSGVDGGAAVRAAWREAGLPGDCVAVTDIEVAYAAGTATPDGLLLLSGTGALAARFAGGQLTRRVDGYGWLAGDEGSAVWIGIRALRAALAALDGRGEPTILVEQVRQALEVEPHTGEALAQALVAAGFARSPAALGRLAPLVSAAGDDQVATGIAAAAVERLLHTFDTLGTRGGEQVVLAGSVLLEPGPIARAVRAGIEKRTGTTPAMATDGAAGAAALAIAELTGRPITPETHALLNHVPARE